MAIRFKDLKGRPLKASDGELGSIKDVLFDDRTWKIRYVVVDTGTWLPGQKVLLNPSSCSSLEPQGEVGVTLTKKQIEAAPPLEPDTPVSRTYESRLHTHYAWSPYWSDFGGAIAYPYPDARFSGPSGTDDARSWSALEEHRMDTFEGHLHSLGDIIGYKISTKDYKEFGEVSDALIVQSDWLVIDLILNSHKWLPGGKEFVCSPMFVRYLDSGEKLLQLEQSKEALIEGPDFDHETYGEAYRKKLVEFYCQETERQSARPSSSQDASL